MKKKFARIFVIVLVFCASVATGISPGGAVKACGANGVSCIQQCFNRCSDVPDAEFDKCMDKCFAQICPPNPQNEIGH